MLIPWEADDLPLFVRMGDTYGISAAIFTFKDTYTFLNCVRKPLKEFDWISKK